MNETSKRKFVIDTDPGNDDAQAILMALNEPDIDVVAITTCHGNASAKQSAINALRILQVANRTDIPIYIGCDKSLLGTTGDSTDYHGKDGLGDSPDPTPPDVSIIQTQHAVCHLVELSRQYSGEITLICLAPLTNVAMALRLYPEFSKNIKECFIMGGNTEGKGNATACAEYNFHCDPEAANIVLSEMACPITLACWELCLQHSMTWEWYAKMVGGDNVESRFIKKVEAKTIAEFYRPKSSDCYITADQIVMATAINKDIATIAVVHANVELQGINTRGQLCIDWTSRHFKGNKLQIIRKLNQELYEEMLLNAVRK